MKNKINKKFLIGALMMSIGFTSCGNSQETIKANKDMKTSTYDVPDGIYSFESGSFNTNNGKVNIIINPSEDRKCTMEVNDNIAEYITVDIDESKKKIVIKGDNKKIFKDMECTITVDAPVSKVDVSGSCKVEYNAGEMDKAEINASGACNVNVKGQCTDGQYNISGSCKISAFDMKCKNLKVEASGAVTAEVYASDKLDVNASGSSSVIYDGKPASVNDNTSGASSIKEK